MNQSSEVKPKQVFPESISSTHKTVLNVDQIKQWREAGFVFVHGVFPSDVVAILRSEAHKRFPAADTEDSSRVRGFGSNIVFPSDISEHNLMTLDQTLLQTVAQLLACSVDDIRLTQSDVWAKYGRDESDEDFDNSDQRMHVDYPNHTLVHPPRWDRPEAVEAIVYLDNIEDCSGPTAVVERLGPQDPAYRWPIIDTPGVADLDYVNDRGRAEDYFSAKRPALSNWRKSLYEREAYVQYHVGAVLFYRHDTWHRGTPLQKGKRRIVMNLTFRRSMSEWISTLHIGWAWASYRPGKPLSHLLANLTVDQRTVLGFPKPGSDYWNSQTLAAVEARYGSFGMDMDPYRDSKLLK